VSLYNILIIKFLAVRTYACYILHTLYFELRQYFAYQIYNSNCNNLVGHPFLTDIITPTDDFWKGL